MTARRKGRSQKSTRKVRAVDEVYVLKKAKYEYGFKIVGVVSSKDRAEELVSEDVVDLYTEWPVDSVEESQGEE